MINNCCCCQPARTLGNLDFPFTSLYDILFGGVQTSSGACLLRSCVPEHACRSFHVVDFPHPQTNDPPTWHFRTIAPCLSPQTYPTSPSLVATNSPRVSTGSTTGGTQIRQLIGETDFVFGFILCVINLFMIIILFVCKSNVTMKGIHRMVLYSKGLCFSLLALSIWCYQKNIFFEI